MRRILVIAVLTMCVPLLCQAAPPTTNALQEAAAVLAKQAAQPVRPYSSRDFGRDRFAGASSVVVEPEEAERVLAGVRRGLANGLVAFIGTTRNLAVPKAQGSEVVVAAAANQFDILRIAATDAVNYGLETEDLIKKLKVWDDAYGIDIFQAETDTVQFRLRSLPKDLPKFAAEVYAFCPDVVDQGTGSVGVLADEIAKTRRVFLWWD